MITQRLSTIPLSILEKIISYTAWPTIMLTSMYCAHIMVRADIPMMLILLIIAVSTLLLSIILELWMPLRDSWKGNKQSIQLDFFHLLFTELAAQGLFRVILFVLSFTLGITLTKPDGTGFWLQLGITDLPLVLQFFIGLAILDLGLYWQHRIFHMNSFFWMAHQVHHTPQELTSISAIRNHFIGPLTTVTLILIFGLIGPSFEVFVMVHAWIIVKGWLQHSNANLETSFFDYLFPTPNIHRWHHSSIRKEADCNFGILCNLWDHFPWHRVPFLGKHLRIQRPTFYRPNNKKYPNNLGISDYDTENKTALEIWWMQFSRPFKEWKKNA